MPYIPSVPGFAGNIPARSRETRPLRDSAVEM